jgi:hypothetical protein
VEVLTCGTIFLRTWLSSGITSPWMCGGFLGQILAFLLLMHVLLWLCGDKDTNVESPPFWLHKHTDCSQCPETWHQLGSLTLPATDAGYFTELLMLYRVLFFSIKVTTYPNLVLRLWLRGAILALPHTFVASTEKNLPYPFTVLFIVSNFCWLSCMIYYKKAFTCSFFIYAWLTELRY